MYLLKRINVWARNRISCVVKRCPWVIICGRCRFQPFGDQGKSVCPKVVHAQHGGARFIHHAGFQRALNNPVKKCIKQFDFFLGVFAIGANHFMAHYAKPCGVRQQFAVLQRVQVQQGFNVVYTQALLLKGFKVGPVVKPHRIPGL